MSVVNCYLRIKNCIKTFYFNWKYERMPFELKKTTLRFKIEEAEKEFKRSGEIQTISLEPGTYITPVTLPFVVRLMGKEGVDEK